MSKRTLAAALLVVTVLSVAILPFVLETDHPAMSEAWVHDIVTDLGFAGPLALIGLMVIAIVASPIPSGPIAVAAGALYGTLWGGACVVAGALLGAFAAFGAARYLGFDAVRRSTNPVLRYIARPRSQFSLMLIVLGSRLIPFISFDAVSYAAGVTSMSFGWFALATFLGVVPISFALAAAGAGLSDGGTDWLLIVALGGAITLLPVVGKWVWDRVRKERTRRDGA